MIHDLIGMSNPEGWVIEKDVVFEVLGKHAEPQVKTKSLIEDGDSVYEVKVPNGPIKFDTDPDLYKQNYYLDLRSVDGKITLQWPVTYDDYKLTEQYEKMGRLTVAYYKTPNTDVTVDIENSGDLTKILKSRNWRNKVSVITLSILISMFLIVIVPGVLMADDDKKAKDEEKAKEEETSETEG
jgi:hypothetical protein